MNLKMKKIFVSWCLSILLVFAVVTGAQAYSSILAFGDSLSDNGFYGANADALPYTSTADVDGFRRYSNGPVWVEHLAQNLGIKLLDYAYGGATTASDNPAASNNFKVLYDASVAAGTPNATYQFLAEYYKYNSGLQWQVDKYADDFGSNINSNTLITVWAGGNDMFNMRSPLDAATNIGLAINDLIEMGGMNFVIPNLNNTNAWTDIFDPALAAVIASLRLANPDINFYDLDMNKLVLTGIDHYDGTYLANAKICSETPDSPECKSGTFAWWDTVGVHPTTEVHKQIGDYASAAVPEPASILLLIIGITGLAGARRRMK